MLCVAAVILVFDTGASDDTASEGGTGLFSLCVEASAASTANQLEAPLDVTLTFSGKGGI